MVGARVGQLAVPLCGPSGRRLTRFLLACHLVSEDPIPANRSCCRVRVVAFASLRFGSPGASSIPGDRCGKIGAGRSLSRQNATHRGSVPPLHMLAACAATSALRITGTITCDDRAVCVPELRAKIFPAENNSRCQSHPREERHGSTRSWERSISEQEGRRVGVHSKRIRQTIQRRVPHSTPSIVTVSNLDKRNF